MSIELQTFTPQDFARLIPWLANGDEIIQWAGPNFTYPLDEKQLEAYWRVSQQVPVVRKIYKAVDTSTGQVIGHIELNNIDARNHSAVVSRVLVNPAERGKGISGEMIRLICAIAFDELYLHRLSLNVYDFNLPAIACYKKAGFAIEGLQRENTLSSKGYWNCYMMSMLEDEWRARPRLSTWRFP